MSSAAQMSPTLRSRSFCVHIETTTKENSLEEHANWPLSRPGTTAMGGPSLLLASAIVLGVTTHVFDTAVAIQPRNSLTTSHCQLCPRFCERFDECTINRVWCADVFWSFSWPHRGFATLSFDNVRHLGSSFTPRTTNESEPSAALVATCRSP
jgi:hypothetical protein